MAVKMAHGPNAKRALVDKASAARNRADKKSNRAVVGGTAAGTIAVLHGDHLMWVAFAVIAVIVGACFFSAWRHGQQADALMTAFKKMQNEQAAAFAAKMAADAAAIEKQKTIEAEQDTLTAARGAVGKVEILNPT